jgi:pilus assembly protein CpaB
MNRRVTAAVIAAVLALGAFVSIFIYVRNADIRALSGVEAKSVYIVVTTVGKGTLAEDLGTNIVLTQVPAKTVPADAVLDLSQIAKKVSSVELVSGEVLLTTRFIDPALQSNEDVAVPKGMQQMSLLVSPQQVRGGVVKAGDTIGVFLTMKATPTGTAPTISIPGLGAVTIDGDALTKKVMSKVLVTRVQGGVTVTTDAKGNSAPAESVMLTVALLTSDVEKLIWAQAAGSLTLTVENKDTDDSSSQYTTGRVVLK